LIACDDKVLEARRESYQACILVLIKLLKVFHTDKSKDGFLLGSKKREMPAPKLESKPKQFKPS